MNYYKQILTVTLWEYKRFFKIKNELIGIVVMLVLGTMGFYGGKYAASGTSEKRELYVEQGCPEILKEILQDSYSITEISPIKTDSIKAGIAETRQGMLLAKDGNQFILYAYKKPGGLNRLQTALDAYRQQVAMQEKDITPDKLEYIMKPASLKEEYSFQPQSSQRRVLAYFFAGLMVMAVFLSFAFQFTAITGEKQLKITEQIVSAIKPQVWMDGKILGITLTGLSSMLIYTMLAILGGVLFFQFTGASAMQITGYLHLPSILLFFVFTLMGILIWNSLLAAIASIITDPNNSGKSSLMMVPVLFVLSSFLIIRDPDNSVAVFLSWFPLTSATGMPIRWTITEISWWQLAGSFALLIIAFYYLKRLAAKIFRVSILISGKEPSWNEVIKMVKED